MAKRNAIAGRAERGKSRHNTPSARARMQYRTLVNVASTALLIAASEACDDSAAPLPQGGAIVTFVFDGTADTLDVLVLDAETIAQARARIETGEGPQMPIGPIVRGAGIDPAYPFRYVPAEVRLTDFAIEVCDAAPMRTSADVSEFFLNSTGNQYAARATWCPWSARPIAVVDRPASD
jgi:hypothetical protein